MDRDDAGARAAAERETLEEVGVRLVGAEQLGRLDDKRGRSKDRPDLIVSAFVYRVHDPEDLVPNHEVQEAFWFPLSELLDPSRRVARPYRELSFPGILIGEPERHVVWGLTYSFLESLFVAVGTPLPNRWPPEMRRDSRGTPNRLRDASTAPRSKA